MSKTYTHSCIKCSTQYEDIDQDPYYCDTCKKQNAVLAAEVDAKIKARGPRRRPMSLLQEYDAAPKSRGFMITKL